MNIATIFILLLIILAVGLAIRSLRRNNGHPCSSCRDCSGCPHCRK